MKEHEQQPNPAPRATLSASEEAAELVRIVPRLERIVIRHFDSARAMGIALDPADLGRVIDALDAEAIELPLDALHENEVKRFALESLQDELRDESLNIFLATTVDSETTRYEILPRSFWRKCLGELRRRCRV